MPATAAAAVALLCVASRVWRRGSWRLRVASGWGGNERVRGCAVLLVWWLKHRLVGLPAARPCHLAPWLPVSALGPKGRKCVQALDGSCLWRGRGGPTKNCRSLAGTNVGVGGCWGGGRGEEA